ncbi:MAG TPA: sigma-70 family RNA polymerase sigma factor [Verrucomicrobiae bacterium]|nr:sigma-70 family RNA polymerase sigma factor [Verrucomicrobiae bacterium]
MTVLEAGAQRAGTLDFAALVREHQSMVFSVAYHFLHDRPVAEEVAQEVFLALHRSLGDLESAAHAAFWLRRVAVQRSIDEARRRKRRPVVALDSIGEPLARGTAAGGAGRDPMLGETLRRLIASLPETPRMVMILRYQEDLDPMEIAATLQMPIGTVKSHLQRSLALLREKLARRGVGEFGWTG